MKHNYLSNTPVEEAKTKYFGFLKDRGFAQSDEIIPVSSASGRITAEALRAVICSPHYNASAMDGIAVFSGDTFDASERDPLVLTDDKFSVVDTGDKLPDGADSVIMVEDVVDNSDGSVTIHSPVYPWQNVRQVGEDICKGDMLAPANTKLTPALCGALLAGGITSVRVIRRPVFGIIPTGDEIVSPTSDPAPGEIIEFNSTIFSAMLREWDAESITYPIVPDIKEKIKESLCKALSECDAVLILAGSSAGRDDYTSEIISSLGDAVIHGIAAKPGKPAVLGCCGSKPVIGLPGYPVSAIVVMNEFVRGAVGLYYGKPVGESARVKAVLGRRLVSSLKYKEYVRVTLGNVGGKLVAMPLSNGAGIITGFTKACGILEIPQNSEGIEEGTQVDVVLTRSEEEIMNSLIITGSHDPVIDELADIMKTDDPSVNVISTHVGSMGAVTAVKNGTAHLGAIHLLDEQTGDYNTSYVKKYFPEGGVTLVKGVNRIQGLMVAPGNPLGIKDFGDAAKSRYVNRQRGAGTRILCDFLMKKNGLVPDDVNGYYNEEFTHTSVAAKIAAGNADAGLGIYSAAAMYGLDFIPVCNEEYDFLVSDSALGHPVFEEFIKALNSEEFVRRIEKLGGYSIER